MQGLDPIADHERFTHLSAEVRYGDPVLTAALYTVAFCRQMAVPSIAAVVHRGGRGPVVRDTRKRNDDTMTFFGELMEHGCTSDRGRSAIARLEQIHAPFAITNDQSLYTLSSLALEADRIPSLLGVRLLTTAERDANVAFWAGVGTAMGLTGVPSSFEQVRAWALAYEQAHWAFTEGGAAVARVMVDEYAARWLPPRLRWLGRRFVSCLCDEALLDALRLPRPTSRERVLVSLGLRAYGRYRQLLPDPKDRSWVDHYGACPDLDRVGYRPTGPEPG